MLGSTAKLDRTKASSVMSTLSQNHDHCQPSADAFSSSAESGLVFIEQLSANRECTAPNRPWLMARDEQQKRLLVYRPGCKLWGCKACAERNRRRWTATIANGINYYQEVEKNAWWFVTLTTHEKLYSFEQQIYVWRDGWLKLYKRMQREAEGKLRYVLLPELAPETNRLHQHMIVNQSFGAKPRKSQKKGYSCSWLHDNPRECGLGYANDIKPVDTPALAAWYTAGYIGKALQVTNWPTNFRRVRTSTDWPELPELPSPGDALSWGLTLSSQVEAQIESAWQLGYDVVNVGTGEMIEVIDLEEIRQEAADKLRGSK